MTAGNKFLKSSLPRHSNSRNFGSAFALTCAQIRSRTYLARPEAHIIPNVFRSCRLYAEEVDNFLASKQRLLRACFEFYKTFNKDRKASLGGRLTLESWQRFCEDS
eukprot:CAMPEP_0196593980 /NCGR_PEP_ID=MMETSP1081-20130531/77066_1 /TAXON_ID=36882 /ORGANISM="Pyramimonas amylifera, Strain CCMP720" /LENGTH=105 /DNA_ID=CAMNT_0041918117 /DNA_START=32 /DNA_END=345 /DNA_ORIENTATION=-